jgi:hypothetical protein
MSGNLPAIINHRLPDINGEQSKGEVGSAKVLTGSARADNSQKDQSF